MSAVLQPNSLAKADARRARLVTLGLGVVFYALVPGVLTLLGSGYYFQVASTALLFIMLAASLNLITGTAGLMSLGHCAFYAVGAYSAALANTVWGMPFPATLLFGAAVSALFGLALALPCMRLSTIYFAVATLGLGEMINTAILNWVSLTRGPMGIFGIRAMSLPGVGTLGKLGSYYVIACVAGLSLYVLHRLTHSYYGNALRALREDDQCAAAMGVDVGALKMQVLAVSAFFAGLAGALLAHSAGFISPEYFRFGESILVLAMVVVGGLGSLQGSVIGASLLIILPEVTRGLGSMRMVVVGLVMFVSILLLPKGLFGEVSAIDMARRWFGAAWPDRRDGLGKPVGWLK